jgi:hypothetical protein
MNANRTHGVDVADLELRRLAMSAIDNGQTCVASHR